ncbi:uncharacterized protein LOC144826643 isoform X2 [Lissotriton helveticus]
MLPLLLLCILISVYLPAEICGALYVLKSEDGVQLECNRSFNNNQPAVWYQTGEDHTYQLEKMKNPAQCASNKVQVPGSGVFACHSSTGTDLCSSDSAPRSSIIIRQICHYDFFIVARRHEGNTTRKKKSDQRLRQELGSQEIADASLSSRKCRSEKLEPDEEDGKNCTDSSAQRTHKEEREPTQDSSDEITKPERKNITLPCNFTTDGSPFILYWIRAAEHAQCLYSVAGVDHEPRFNEHCCVHEEKNPRIHNHSDKHISAKIQKHNIEIKNATSSDSGHYLCIGARLIKQPYQWEIVRNISLLVEKKNGTKGVHEGSPYAVGMKDKDASATEPYYASVKTPRAPEYSLLEASTVTAPKSKTETSTVYALAQM